MVLLCFGWFIVSALTPAGRGCYTIGYISGATDNGFAGLLLFDVMAAATAVAVLWGRRYPLHVLLPRPSWVGACVGIALYLCAKALSMAAGMITPHQAWSPVDDMIATAHVSWYSVIALALVSGSYEEIFLLGYLMRGLRRYGASVAIGASVLVRLLYQMYQGPEAALSTVLFGIVVGCYYHYRGRLFPVALAHVIANIMPFFHQSA